MSRGKADLLSRCSPTLEVALGDRQSSPSAVSVDSDRVAEGLNANAEAPTLSLHGDVKITNLEEGDLSDATDSTLRGRDETCSVNSGVLNFFHVYHYTYIIDQLQAILEGNMKVFSCMCVSVCK
jgi:hypothetical protein